MLACSLGALRVLLSPSDGHVSSLYRCRSTGHELRHLGVWLSNMSRRSVITSRYAPSSTDAQFAAAPACLSHLYKKVQKHTSHATIIMDEDGDEVNEKVNELKLNWTQEELEEMTECGVTMQNLAEYY
jgi:hypothetical protein